MFNNFTFYPCLVLFILCLGQTVCLLLAKHRCITVKRIRRKTVPTPGMILIHIETYRKNLDNLYTFYGKLCSNPFNLQNPQKNSLFVKNSMKKNYEDFLHIKKELQKNAKQISLLAEKTNTLRFKCKLPCVALQETNIYLPAQIPPHTQWIDFVENEQSGIFYAYAVLQENLTALQKAISLLP